MQLALTLGFRPTGPADWLLSFREVRRELRMGQGLLVLGTHIVGAAVKRAPVGDLRWLVEQGFVGLVERSLLEPSHYMPGADSPILAPNPGVGCAQGKTMNEDYGWGARRTPAWSWKYRVPSQLPWEAIKP